MPASRRRLRFALVLLPILAIFSVVVWRVMWAAPAWYRLPDVTDPAVIELADAVEYRLVEEAHRLREAEEPFTIRLREEQANAWLAARLPKWIIQRGLEWPEELGTPQVRFVEEGIDLAGDVRTALGRRYMTLRIEPRIEADQLLLAVTRVSLGQFQALGAGAEQILDLLGPERKAQVLASEYGSKIVDATGEGAAFDPVFALADGRRVRLLALRVHDGAVDLTASAVPEH